MNSKQRCSSKAVSNCVYNDSFWSRDFEHSFCHAVDPHFERRLIDNKYGSLGLYSLNNALYTALHEIITNNLSSIVINYSSIASITLFAMYFIPLSPG